MATGLMWGTGDNSLQAPTYALQATHRFGRSFNTDPPVAFSGTFTMPAASAGTGEINLFRLPPGRVRVYTDLSRIVASQFEGTSDLHLGHRAYTEPDGTVVNQNATLFGDDIDVGGGAIDAAPLTPLAGFHEFNSRDGVTIYSLIDTRDMETDDTLAVHLFYKYAV